MNQRARSTSAAAAPCEETSGRSENRPRAVATSQTAAEECVQCQVGDGLPTVSGQAWSYYISQGDGHRMLVLARKPGQRIRINDTAVVVVLGIVDGQVKVGIEQVSDAPVADCG